MMIAVHKKSIFNVIALFVALTITSLPDALAFAPIPISTISPGTTRTTSPKTAFQHDDFLHRGNNHIQSTVGRTKHAPALYLIKELVDDYGDIVVGMFTVFCATSPYILGTVFPTLMNKFVFLGVYKPASQLKEEGKEPTLSRSAEITWKCMFSAVGFFLTLLPFAQAYGLNTYSGADVLRDQFVVWAVFYILATGKLWYEGTVKDILAGGRLGAQLWHITVASILLYSVSTGPTAPIITRVFGP